LKYVSKGATKKKAKKASHMGAFILIMGLNNLPGNKNGGRAVLGAPLPDKTQTTVTSFLPV